MTPVAVLFARRDSIYKRILGTDVWDEGRDARNWPGGAPIIAHPPCRMWGCLKAKAKGTEEEKKLAIWAVQKIRRYGGVLEHPSGSSLWKVLKLPPPGGLPDEFGGWSLRVNQFHWGHRARKTTLLYIVGIQPAELPARPKRSGQPTHMVTNVHGIRKGHPKWKPEIKKPEREGTPPEFARWLCELARRCRTPRIRIIE